MYVSQFFLEWEIFQGEIGAEIWAHFIFRDFDSEYRTVYEVMWKIVVKVDRPQVSENTAHAHCILDT
jgi:uncharacterized phage-like protein YoqJ